MYNRYIPETVPHTHTAAPGGQTHRQGNRVNAQPQPNRPQRPQSNANPLDSLGGLLKKLDLGNLFQSLGLGGLDTGDILLLAILLLLFLEGDNWELIIILGLLVLFGLGDDDDEEEDDDGYL